MPEDFVQVAPDSTGAKIHTRSRVIGANTVEEQFVIVQEEKIVTYQGRFASFRIPGRAAVSQNLAAIHNATGSAILVRVNRVIIDWLSLTAGKVATIQSPIVRVRRFTALPTSGNAGTKVPRDSALSSNASLTLWQDASSDRTGSGTTLTITAGNILGEANAPRLLTAGTAASMSYEQADPFIFFQGESDVILRALEGLVITAEDAIVTTGNPATDYWTVVIDWDEYTLP
jgi:hypothetical protein